MLPPPPRQDSPSNKSLDRVTVVTHNTAFAVLHLQKISSKKFLHFFFGFKILTFFFFLRFFEHVEPVQTYGVYQMNGVTVE